MKHPEFAIPPAPWDEVERSIKALAAQGVASSAERDNGAALPIEMPESFLKGMADLATHVWKARSRMIDPATGEVREEMKRVHGDIQRIERSAAGIGIVIEDQTSKPFDYGLPWKVVASKPVPGLNKEIVTETLRPTIRWNGVIIQHAEVEIGTPVET
jgi:hypothetical protein